MADGTNTCAESDDHVVPSPLVTEDFAHAIQGAGIEKGKIRSMRIREWAVTHPEQSFCVAQQCISRRDAPASLLSQGEGVDIRASNVAEQQWRVCGVQPHIPSKPSSVVPIL